MWAEELEKWLPFLLPIDIHLGNEQLKNVNVIAVFQCLHRFSATKMYSIAVFGRKNNLADNAKTPKVVVISYTMLKRLRKNMMRHKWAVLIVDESHNLRCTRNKVECEEVFISSNGLSTKISSLLFCNTFFFCGYAQ
jgi:SNF2 family DNA or RNA helicase